MSKSPIPANENERLKALQNYEVLDTLAEVEFDRITKLASMICGSPISLISLIDEKRQWFKSKIGMTDPETSRDIAFCQYAILDTEILEVEDATQDERFKDNPLVKGDPKIRFYAGCPLIDPAGLALGTLCVIDQQPKVLTGDQKESLQLLAAEVIDLIVERRKKEELKHFEKLFNVSNDLLFIGGMDGFFKRINPAFHHLLGWDEQYLLMTSTFDLIHPDDIETTQNELKKLAQGQPTVNFIQRFKASSGAYKAIQWTSSPEPSTGNIFGIGRNITEIRLKEQQLAESEKKLRVFFENSQGLMCTHELDGQFISVNSAGAAILGYTVEEITRLSLYDIIPTERHDRLKDYLAKIRDEGHAKGQMITLHQNGSPRVWLFNNTLEQTAGSNAYIIGNGIDITERYKLEKELEHTREMLEQTNKVARVGGWEFDVKQQTIFWSSVTREIHGAAADYIPDLTTAINFYKEGESRDKITEVLTAAMTTGKPWEVQLQITTLQGKDLWVRSLGDAEFEDGVCKRIYGTFQDVNDYKLAQQALELSIQTQEALNDALLEKIELVKEQDQTIEKIQEFKFLADSIPEIVWTTMPDGRVDYYNQFWFDYSGMTLQETNERGWIGVMHPDDIPKCTEAWTASFATGKPFEAEYRLKRGSDGMFKWHMGKAQPMKNEKGEVIKWFGSSIDIDQYKKALELQKKIGQYEDFNRIVAHNLRGPSGSIGMLITMLEDAANEEERAELMPMLRQSSTTLNETLNDLMQVLEVRNNHNLEYDNCKLTEIVEGVEKMLSGQIISTKAVIMTKFKIEYIKFPKIYLESIFYNMISNALKYSRAEVPPEITVSSEQIGDKILLKFKDNGLGIDLKKHGSNMFKLNKIFHRGFDSKGVGLFMTKTQIETFGGSISVESEPNVGSEFTIEL